MSKRRPHFFSLKKKKTPSLFSEREFNERPTVFSNIFHRSNVTCSTQWARIRNGPLNSEVPRDWA